MNAVGLPTMVINGRYNKPFGPGGSTRRLHQNSDIWVLAGATQDRRGRKKRSFARHCIHRYRAKLVVANDNYAEVRLAA